MQYDSVLIEPVLTEKTNILREEGKYVFKVDPRSSKPQIMEAVRRMFKVHPQSCAVINVTPKPKRTRGRSGYTASWKKAIIKLAKGETIGIFEGV
ncbi:MAG: 50S ribosomal protein L23 [Spirochaetes bacterium]|nr:50S ribosomal protein L23 [Spirochaetota bacterium]